MKVNLDQLLEGVSRLPRQKLTEENSEKLRRYDYLLDLLTEDYISSEHLAVPEAEWHELEEFLYGLFGTELNNAHAEKIRTRINNLEITKRFGQLLLHTPLLPIDDFI